VADADKNKIQRSGNKDVEHDVGKIPNDGWARLLDANITPFCHKLPDIDDLISRNQRYAALCLLKGPSAKPDVRRALNHRRPNLSRRAAKARSAVSLGEGEIRQSVVTELRQELLGSALYADWEAHLTTANQTIDDKQRITAALNISRIGILTIADPNIESQGDVIASASDEMIDPSFMNGTQYLITKS